MIKEIHYKETYTIRHEVMWPNKPISFIELEEDPNGLHYGYFNEGILIAVVSIFIKDNKAQFRKFATLIDYQGRGVGSQLLTYVLGTLSGMDTIWCNARIEKVSYYERFGMEKTDQVFEKGGQLYVIMAIKKSS